MKISDIDICNLPPLMGMFVDYLEAECGRLLEESPQFMQLIREDHELLDEYDFLNMITDSNGITKALKLNYEETEALARFCLFSRSRYQLLETTTNVSVRDGTCYGGN